MTIGSDVWNRVGGGAIILPGVTIGDPHRDRRSERGHEGRARRVCSRLANPARVYGRLS